jgi:putative transposase
MVECMNPALPISQQCRLLALPRSSVYRKPAEVSAEDLASMALIDRQYLARPYYGSRRMAAWLATQGHHVNRKRVQRLMRLLGLAAIYQRPNTSKPAAAHKIYPYLLRGLAIERVNQVWCSDITYIPMAKGFLYLVVIMDWVSRAVLAWRLSNTLDADFCVEALEEALSRYGRPEIFNTDQGSQFTSDDFTGTLKRHGVTISMDGKSLPSRKRGAGAWTTSSSNGCGAVSNTKRSTSMPMPQWPKPRPALAAGWTFTTRSASTRAWVIARRGKFTSKACGYVDDRRCRLAALPPLPERARKAGKCSPSPTYPQALQSIKRFILMLRKAEALHQPLHRQ